MRSKWAVALSLVVGFAMATAARAEEKVIKIGTIFPLTGPCAVAGERCKAAVETMAEVINNKHPELNIPLAKQEGILGGYKIVLVNADQQGKPDVAKSRPSGCSTRKASTRSSAATTAPPPSPPAPSPSA